MTFDPVTFDPALVVTLAVAGMALCGVAIQAMVMWRSTDRKADVDLAELVDARVTREFVKMEKQIVELRERVAKLELVASTRARAIEELTLLLQENNIPVPEHILSV